jgi:hypothetical protein
MSKIKKIKETDVILNFMEDSVQKLRKDPEVAFEFPAGSWRGSRKRNMADIHGSSIPAIEAKSDFRSACDDVDNTKKNFGISHYIYSSENVCEEEVGFWKQQKISAAVFLTSVNSWAILNDIEGFFGKTIRKDKQATGA